MVILPDFFRVKLIDPLAENTEKIVEYIKAERDWENKLKKECEVAKDYAVSHGAKTFGALGKAVKSRPFN